MAYDVVIFLENLCQTSRLFRAEELPERWREWYEERAGIREFDGGWTRDKAENQAMEETVKRMGKRKKTSLNTC